MRIRHLCGFFLTILGFGAAILFLIYILSINTLNPLFMVYFGSFSFISFFLGVFILKRIN
jgi:hypothetical protein